ncbi:MAG: Putative pterin-4-alpha-carbinolamine dehydratase [Cryomorphaceae bacterium]|nr:4a-hydroxytetrahydrobiopterin dehydratase [Cryomorphaceae bacterium]CAI8158872.1 MAG: Putative pterin-4-alpha-carbinolamine dehydratase [Cryomorphaceae bacterium]
MAGNNRNHLWDHKETRLERTFVLPSFQASLDFVAAVGAIAEACNHHPFIAIDYRTVVLYSTTHDEGNVVTDLDHELAQKIDAAFAAVD